jgi:hypothetical protein
MGSTYKVLVAVNAHGNSQLVKLPGFDTLLGLPDDIWRNVLTPQRRLD